MEAHFRIGNLLPLAESANGKIGDMPFVQKIAYYEKSNFVSVRNFISRHGRKTDWTEQDIDNRATHMAELAYNKIWPIDGIIPEVE